jgi:hypothetical protein
MHNTTQQQAIYPLQLMVGLDWGKDFEAKGENKFTGLGRQFNTTFVRHVD